MRIKMLTTAAGPTGVLNAEQEYEVGGSMLSNELAQALLAVRVAVPVRSVEPAVEVREEPAPPEENPPQPRRRGRRKAAKG